MSEKADLGLERKCPKCGSLKYTGLVLILLAFGFWASPLHKSTSLLETGVDTVWGIGLTIWFYGRGKEKAKEEATHGSQKKGRERQGPEDASSSQRKQEAPRQR